MPSTVNNILDITSEMLCAAENGEWDKLGILEDSRSTMLSRLSVDDMGAEGQESENVLVQAIESILDIDQRIIKLCTAESSSCKDQVRDFVKGRKAIASYHQFSG